jgi:hypothetical protein
MITMSSERTMSATTNPNVRYSMESVRAIEMIQEQIGERLRQRATERALSQGRDLVSFDDVVESILETLKLVLEAQAQQKPEG